MRYWNNEKRPTEVKNLATTLLLALLATTAAAQSHSVLATGDWWKIGVENDGIYRLTTVDIPALAGTPVDRIAVYGGGGGMLSLNNSQTPIGDLAQVATQVVDHNGNGTFDAGDELLFYGEGPDQWVYDDDLMRWRFVHHAYAVRNHYYLTTSATAPLRIATADAPAAEAVVSRHTVVANIDNDLVNILQTGQLWMGERFSSAVPSRSFTLRLPGNNISDVKLRYALANKSNNTGTFSVATTGYSRQISIGSSQVYSTNYADLPQAAQAYTFALDFHPGESSANGYLDYIELCAQADIALGGGQTLVRCNPQGAATARFVAQQAAGLRVWDVTRQGRERELAVTQNSWIDSASTARRYLLFDGTYYLSPADIAPLENQDLHGSGPADLVVVANPLFLPQAQRLAALHEIFDGLSTLVVTDQQVFNEYSHGQQDPLAFRSLLRWLDSRHPSQPPRYLLLFGKGTYDNRNLSGHSLPTVALYETEYSFDDNGISYASDAILGYLSPTGRGMASEVQSVSVGRLPAKSTAEADHLVGKIEAYITRRDLLDDNSRGDWRNYVALLADDADPGRPSDSLFAHSSEVVATDIRNTYPQLHVDRLYADAYHQASGAIGSYYPDLNNALQQRINYGCLLLNYIGHGSTAYIGTERYIAPADIAAYSNTDRLPLLVTSTCSYGRHDLTDALCGAEECILAPAAMVSVISASRPISHVERFNKDVVLFALNPDNAIGDALRKARNLTPSSLSIGIIGDPALRLSQPSNRVVVTHINTQPVDGTADIQADVLSRVTVSGEIVDSNGTLLTDFDGTIYPVVYDRATRSSTLANDNPGTEVAFLQQKNILYKGTHTVSGGRFEYSFIVPMDVSYRYDYAKLSHYAKSGTDHAAGSFTRLMFGGMSDSAATGQQPPSVRLFVSDTTFRNGGLTGPNPTLVALISDSAGINVGSGLGHDITAIIDGNPNSIIVLNDLYQPDIADSRHGTVAYTLANLAPGRHTATLKAWNIFGLSASATVEFTVRGSDTISLSDLQCAPNPATAYTEFTLRLNTPERIASAELQIYNSRGQMILSTTPDIATAAYMIGPIKWDVSAVPPGLYLARILLTDTDGDTHQTTTKCIVH